MRRAMFHTIKHIASGLLAMVVLVPALLVLASSTNADADLLWLRAIQDEQAYPKSRGRYTRVAIPPSFPGGKENVYYVERIPALRIRLREMKSVTAEKTPIDPELEKLTEEILRSRGKGETILKDDPDDYTITFTLTEQGAQKFREFAKKHDQEKFAVRFGPETLGVRKFHGPYEQNAVVFFSTRDTVKHLKKKYPQLHIK